MLESVFIILLILAIIMLLLAVSWESIVLSLIDSIIWFIMAISVMKIEVPYQYVSGGSVETALQEITNLVPISYLFAMIGLVMGIYWIVLVLETLGKRNNMMRGI